MVQTLIAITSDGNEQARRKEIEIEGEDELGAHTVRSHEQAVATMQRVRGIQDRISSSTFETTVETVKERRQVWQVKK